MKGFFRAIYEVIGLPQPSSETPVYREVIFPNIGLLNIGITLALLVLFYLVINRYMRVATFSRPRHWALFLGLNALIAFVIVIAQATRDFEAMLTTGAAPTEELGDLVALQGVAKFHVLVKCALLAWKVLQQALAGQGEPRAMPVSTE